MKKTPTRIYMLGAHGGYKSLNAPLGGGATIFECLVDSWSRRPELELEKLSPGPAYGTLHSFLEGKWKGPKDLKVHHPASLGYLDYARFCRAFESAAMEYFKSVQANQSWIIANDISEGPDFRTLKQLGYKVATLVHVDVVEFVSNLYLKRKISSHRMAHYWRKLRSMGLTRLVPDLVHLIFEKQEAAYQHSDLIIVPSHPMKDVIKKCYPSLNHSKVKVVPWGYPGMSLPQRLSVMAVKKHKDNWGIRETDFVLLSLSRISPEKGIDRTLKGLIELERMNPDVARRVCYLLVGSAAYMDGPAYEKKLRSLAAQLKHVRVIFAGHLTGELKAAAFQSAKLYAFMSYHESYGLTLSEARQWGLTSLVSEEAARGESPPAGVTVCKATPDRIAAELLKFVERGMPRHALKEPEPLFDRAADRILELMQI